MARTVQESLNAAEVFNFPSFIQTRFQDSKFIDPTQTPAHDQDRRSIATLLEAIDRLSVQGILVRTILTHIHDDFSQQVAIKAAVHRVAHAHSGIVITHALWVQEATGGPAVDALDSVKGMLENIPPATLRNILLEGLLMYADAATATLTAFDSMTPALSTALSEIEAAYQSCMRALQETRRLLACSCASDISTATKKKRKNDEFLESCCETKSQITSRKEHLHLTVRTIGRAAELTPAWESRRDAWRALDKLYWKCKSWNVFLADGEEGTDEVRCHFVDSLVGLAENMGPAERQRCLDEGYNFKVLETLDGKIYDELKEAKRTAENLRASLPQTKTNKDSTNSQTPEKHMSDVAGIRKAETKRLARRRLKDRKALEKALRSLGL